MASSEREREGDSEDLLVLTSNLSIHDENAILSCFHTKLVERVAKFCDLADVSAMRLVSRTMNSLLRYYLVNHFLINLTKCQDEEFAKLFRSCWCEAKKYPAVLQRMPLLERVDVGGSKYDTTTEFLSLIEGLNVVRLTLPSFLDFLLTAFKFPATLTHLTFGIEFNTNTIAYLPSTITHLKVDVKLNQKVSKWPSNLTHLTFGVKFNRDLDNLPSSLTHLTFGAAFNSLILEVPRSLKYLKFGFCYNKPLPPDLPPLDYLEFSDEIRNTEPQSANHFKVTKLVIWNHNYKPNPSYQPFEVTHLRINGNFPLTQFNTVTHLTYLPLFKGPLPDELPNSITHLYLSNAFNHPVDNLPSSLRYLFFGEQFNQPVNHLPSSLQYISFGKNFQQLLDQLPCSITHLVFDDAFCQPLIRLPYSLTHLTLGLCYNQSLEYLPKSVKYLVLGEFFTHPIPQALQNATIIIRKQPPLSSLSQEIVDQINNQVKQDLIFTKPYYFPEARRNLVQEASYLLSTYDLEEADDINDFDCFDETDGDEFECEEDEDEVECEEDD